MNFVDHEPDTEVRFRIDRSKATSSAEVLDILKKVYGEKDTWTQMQLNLYSRQQRVGESLDDYSQSLIQMILKMEKLNPSLIREADVMPKEQSAEGVLDVSLRRELKCLNKERPNMEFRNEADDWIKDACTIDKEKVTQEAVSIAITAESPKLDNIMQYMYMQQQLQSIEEIIGIPTEEGTVETTDKTSTT